MLNWVRMEGGKKKKTGFVGMSRPSASADVSSICTVEHSDLCVGKVRIKVSLQESATIYNNLQLLNCRRVSKMLTNVFSLEQSAYRPSMKDHSFYLVLCGFCNLLNV